MGRRAAGESFLHAFARDSKVDRLYGYCKTRQSFESFEKTLSGLITPDQSIEWIPFGRLRQLERPGCLFFGSPGIADLAWHRRHVGSRSYSLCGLTHTTASHAVMDAVGALPIAPIQSWDAIICTSQAVKKTIEHVLEGWLEYLASRLDAKPTIPVQLPVIPLGVDCARFAGPERSGRKRNRLRQEFRQKYGIGNEDLAVLYFGRLSFHAKAHPLPMYIGLERAAQQLKARVHLIQVGWFANDYIEGAFREGAKQYCPSVNAIFLDGREPDVRANIWFAADLFTSLSDNIQETFGLVPIEAMAAGLPVVVSDWDGYRDTVRSGLDGLTVPTVTAPPGSGRELAFRYELDLDSYDRYIGHASQCTAVDVAACAEAYYALLSNAELRKKMGAAGQKRARETFDWPIIIAAYQELWRELQARREKSDDLAPPPRGKAVNPLREDPFSLFGSYPSTLLQANSVVSLREKGQLPDLAALRADALTSASLSQLAGQQDCEKLLAHLRGNDPSLVSEVLKLSPKGQRREVLLRTLVWLAKVGIVSISRAEPT
jgi:glycosyltransferase involved in cell wall biosynthesis